ncbi:MAG TPA: 5'-3' exonuclease H3TH domain-containing protein [Candidatus Paceibacterota bacterium]|nr:5'-3' exonuclease H3TH domain-containing protein [Candidatus Paceibacterota bacterium]
MEKEHKRILIIDANSIIHRAFHALPILTTKKGEITNAVYGFLLVFFKAIKDFHPDYIAACFDLPLPTFRHKKYKLYKAKRPKAPEELYQQIPRIKEVLKLFNVPIFEKQGFEADDIIGTIAALSPRKQIVPPIETIIASGDLDALQLVNKQTKLFALRKGVKDVVLYDEGLVEEKFQGLLPEQVLDFKALRGDASDNIPGVTGIGEKTAIELLLKFSTLDNLYKELEENSEKAKNLKPKQRETLLKYREQAFLSRDLAQIEKNVPIDFNLEKCSWINYDKAKAADMLKELEFYTLVGRLPDFDKPQEKIKENLKLW